MQIKTSAYSQVLRVRSRPHPAILLWGSFPILPSPQVTTNQREEMKPGFLEPVLCEPQLLTHEKRFVQEFKHKNTSLES